MVHTEIKSVVVGEAGVGKTSLSAYFCLGSCPTNPASTVGASFLQKRVNIANSSTNATECCLQIWDTAGQERFRALAPMYYRGAKAAVIVCDCTNMESFTRCVSWMEDLQQVRDVEREERESARGERARARRERGESEPRASEPRASEPRASELSKPSREQAKPSYRNLPLAMLPLAMLPLAMLPLAMLPLAMLPLVLLQLVLLQLVLYLLLTLLILPPIAYPAATPPSNHLLTTF